MALSLRFRFYKGITIYAPRSLQPQRIAKTDLLTQQAEYADLSYNTFMWISNWGRGLEAAIAKASQVLTIQVPFHAAINETLQEGGQNREARRRHR